MRVLKPAREPEIIHQMDLYHHDQPSFTRWVTELLREPLVVIDVGVQGGEHPRWDFLGNAVRIYGFDPIAEAISQLGAKPHRSYRTLALGNEDGSRDFYIPANRFGASFFDDGSHVERRSVPIARLDTLAAAGEIPPADFLKLDTESFEGEVLRGARNYLAQSNIVAMTAETSFVISRLFPRTQLSDIYDIALDHRLAIADISYVRYPCSSYVIERERLPWPPADPLRDVPRLDVGRPGTVDLLFCRDFVAEAKVPEAFSTYPGAVTEPTVDKLIKAMIIFELHGLMDCAVDIAVYFRPTLAERLDVDIAIEHLLQPPPYARNTADVVECLRMIAELRRERAGGDR